MTGAGFARALAERLAAVLPPGFMARSVGAKVYLDAPDSIGSATSLGHLDAEDVEPQDYADAAWNVLSMAQDVVSETATDPWPAAAGSGSDLAEPWTSVHGTELRLGFGADDAPAMTLPPIPLEE
jgi:hypothetical protein